MNPAIADRIASTAFIEKAKELIHKAGSQDATGAEKHRMVVDGLVRFIDDLDEAVTLVPYVGSILDALLDTQPAQEVKRGAVQFAVELIYQTLKLEGDA